MQPSRRGKGNRQEPVLQHQFWPIKSVKRELCKSENTCVHRLVHVTCLAISGDGVLGRISRHPKVTGDICIKKKGLTKDISLILLFLLQLHRWDFSNSLEFPGFVLPPMRGVHPEGFPVIAAAVIVPITINVDVNSCGAFSLF